MPLELDGIFSECTLFSKHRNRKLMFGLFFFCLAFKTPILYNVTHCLPMQCIFIVWMMQKSGIKISVKTIKPVSFPVHSLSVSLSFSRRVCCYFPWWRSHANSKLYESVLLWVSLFMRALKTISFITHCIITFAYDVIMQRQFYCKAIRELNQNVIGFEIEHTHKMWLFCSCLCDAIWTILLFLVEYQFVLGLLL